MNVKVNHTFYTKLNSDSYINIRKTTKANPKTH